MSPSLTDWTAGQNAQRKAGADHTAHGFATQMDKICSVPGNIQDYAFGNVLTALNRLHYTGKQKKHQGKCYY